MTFRHKRMADAALIAAVAILMMSSCSAGSPAETPDASAPASSSTTSPDPEQQESEEPHAGAVEAFLAWVEAARVPDVDTACAGLAPDLQARMIAELNAGGAVSVETCEQMISTVAELYRAVGDDGSVDVEVQAETDTDATLFVTYLASGDCGTVVMERTGTEWIITDESEECAG